jgi:hypothetical protein
MSTRAGAWPFASCGEPLDIYDPAEDYDVRERRDWPDEYVTTAGRDIAACREAGVPPFGEL